MFSSRGFSPAPEGGRDIQEDRCLQTYDMLTFIVLENSTYPQLHTQHLPVHLRRVFEDRRLNPHCNFVCTNPLSTTDPFFKHTEGFGALYLSSR